MSLLLVAIGSIAMIALSGLRLHTSLQPVRSPIDDRVAVATPVRLRPRRTTGRVVGALRERSRRGPPSDDEVADWCESMARLLRSGSSLVGAVRSAPVGERLATALAPVHLATRRGGRLTTALDGARGSSTGLDRAITVIRVCLDVGGHTAIALDRTAASLRDRTALLAERRAQAAQARLSALVLTLLPGGAVVLMAFVSANLRAALLSPIGAICLPAAAVLNIAGWWWMRTLSAAPP